MPRKFLLCQSQETNKVGCFQYTVHTCSGQLAQKLGCNVLFRRAVNAEPVVVSLVRSHEITKISSDNLSMILNMYNSKLRKNATKTQKIRTLLSLAVITDSVSKETIDGLVALLDKLDEQRKKKNASTNPDDDEDEELEERMRFGKPIETQHCKA